MSALIPAAASGFGQLSPSAGGCFAQPTNAPARNATQGCTSGAALIGASGVTVSPDGHNVYVASGYSAGAGWGGVAIFRRNTASGSLKEVGCISSDATNGIVGSNGACVLAPGLLGADAVTVSPNGLTVYVAAARLGNIDAFTRDPATGLLTGLRGCFVEVVTTGSQCLAGRVFRQSSALSVGPSGQFLYAGSTMRGAISELADDTFSFVTPPTQPPIVDNPCISVAGPENTCVNGSAMNSIDSLSMSRDGTTLYAASSASGAVDTFNVDPVSGILSQSGCLMHAPPPGPCQSSQLLSAPTSVAASPDGSAVYVADSGNRLIELARNPTTGQLSDGSCYDEAKLGAHGDSGPCTPMPALNSLQAVAVSPDSTTVYTVGDNALAELERDPATGRLIETACAAPMDQRCSTPTGLGGASALALSPDGETLYVAAAGSSAVTAWGAGATVTSGHAAGAIAYLNVSCPLSARSGCAGNITLGRLELVPAQAAEIATMAAFHLRAGGDATVRVRIAQRLARIDEAKHVIVVQALVEPTRGGGGASARTIALLPHG